MQLTGAKQSNVSHLRLLRDAGVTRAEPCGRSSYDVLEPGRLRAVGGQLSTLADAASGDSPRKACP